MSAVPLQVQFEIPGVIAAWSSALQRR